VDEHADVGELPVLKNSSSSSPSASSAEAEALRREGRPVGDFSGIKNGL
jgi:hypothetical protein